MPTPVRDYGRIFLPLLLALASIKAEDLAGIQPDLSQSNWIWADAEGDGFALADEAGADLVYLRRVFDIQDIDEIESAVLTATGDNSVDVWINGQPLGQPKIWTDPLVADVTDKLVSGANVIALQGINIALPKDPAGVVAKVVIDRANGSEEAIVTDTTWRGSSLQKENWNQLEFDDSAWPNAVSLVPLGGFPWGFHAKGSGDGWSKMPDFYVNGELELLGPLHDLLLEHYRPGISCTLWDPWIPKCILWVGTTPELTREVRRFYASSFLERKISLEGYVEMRQHRGLGLPDGWPFPLWTQGPGAGWHFSLAGAPFGAVNGIHLLRSIDGWELQGAAFSGFDDLFGLRLDLSAPDASLTTPVFEAQKIVSPYIRLEWRASGIEASAEPYLEWTTASQPEFSEERRIYFSPPLADELTFTVLPLYRVPGWQGPITQMRINFDNEPGAKVDITGLFTAVDSRKPVTNPDFIIGSVAYFNWTGDLNFLRGQINRLRMAMQYALVEFDVMDKGLAYVGWPGHEGRSGVLWENGNKVHRPGEGIGNNYFDLLPFGGWDTYLNVKIYAAISSLAELEEAIKENPQWNMPQYPWPYDGEELRALANQLKTNFQEKFWNVDTGRFVAAIDADGVAYDYGFTPVNLDAIFYGLASEKQAREIMEWLDGDRIVESDTSQGGDIYKWRFAPRITTLRNIDYYAYVWFAPETIPFGNQIQDGGAVLGFSFYDIMARIKTLGPDNAWERLSEILSWYREVEAYGGPRKYYADHDGTLQGGGTAGGLGIDHEFFESSMLPSAIIYGFIGLKPGPEDITANPRFPSDWDSLTVTDIVYRDWRFDLNVNAAYKQVSVRLSEGSPQTFPLKLPKGWDLNFTK